MNAAPITKLKPTPWDTLAIGMPTWELLEYSIPALEQTGETGHYTIKVDPLTDKRLLQKYGFYYCDTLIEPCCDTQRLRRLSHLDATISKTVDADRVLAICHGAFSHGRFHRDFNLPKLAADLRYDNWLAQLVEAQQVYGLYWQGGLAGFIGHIGNSLALHALADGYRGKGLAKYWWSAVCGDLLSVGNQDIRSSISAGNVAVLNLYASLGFLFKNPLDVYHKCVR